MLEGMKVVTRDEFVEHVNKHRDWRTNPVEASTMSVMQYINKAGKVVAQAIYRQPPKGERVRPEYQIRSST